MFLLGEIGDKVISNSTLLWIGCGIALLCLCLARRRRARLIAISLSLVIANAFVYADTFTESYGDLLLREIGFARVLLRHVAVSLAALVVLAWVLLREVPVAAHKVPSSKSRLN